ncbi:hypothetical protein FN846DRAFT_913367 [Sphaerosporella brunnea]|uniref:Uncharacterized protein n=1 Tax=Sphaerosporella brunnea TaxID=1250544 RepID=A0A5J5EFL6_9PEZI|nr:hypothetical protein FN846DRAFT_913367 [Sphaerosporella brunnea]
MDPSDEQHDDDLFADLYGDDESPKSSPSLTNPTQTETTPIAIQSKDAGAHPAPVASDTRTSAPTLTPAKAIDPRAPQSPTETQVPEAQQPEELHRPHHTQDFGGWDAANMSQGHGGNDNDHMASNAFLDQSAGSPAIKEDGEGRETFKIAEDMSNGPQPLIGE